MRRLLTRIRTQAPFLFGERGTLALTRSLRDVGGGAATFTAEVDQSGLTLTGTHEGEDLQGKRLSGCDVRGAELVQLDLTESVWTRCDLRGARLRDCSAGSSDWEVVDLTDASLAGLKAPGSRFSLVSFRDADLSGCDLSGSSFVLCDFSGAQLADVDLRGARFVGCDFEGTIFASADATGADLRSSVMRDAWIAGLTLDGAEVAGADFRHACAVSRTQHELLSTEGARLGGAFLYRGWAWLLAKDGSSAAHRRSLRAVTLTWAALAILIPILFFVRAIVDPIEPDYGPDIQSAEGEED